MRQFLLKISGGVEFNQLIQAEDECSAVEQFKVILADKGYLESEVHSSVIEIKEYLF